MSTRILAGSGMLDLAFIQSFLPPSLVKTQTPPVTDALPKVMDAQALPSASPTLTRVKSEKKEVVLLCE